MGYIYLRTNKVNGKQYVGQVIEKRFKKRQQSWNDLKHPYAGTLINRARAKYGLEAFGFEILKECSDDELDYWEMYYIEKLNTKAPNGYNLTDGGGGMHGYVPSEETRRKLSEANTGKQLTEETKRKLSEANTGKPLTEETKRKLSEANTGEKNPNYGKPLSEEHKKKISESRKGKPRSEETKKKISESKKGQTSWNKGKPMSDEQKRKLSKAVLQIDPITNQVIAEFPSGSEVERQLGFKHSCISRCCLGKLKSAYNFIWQYKMAS